MSRRKPTLRVLFRVSHEPPYFQAPSEVVTAVFDDPDMPGAPGTDFTCYAHVGQHGDGTLGWYHTTRRARPSEYAPLLRELRQIYSDCRLIVGKRRVHI